jgi:hypothetical protein
VGERFEEAELALGRPAVAAEIVNLSHRRAWNTIGVL